MTCGEGQVYSPCGSPCQPSCNNTMQQTQCITTCIEGCVCKDGLVMDGDRCIPPDQCGCEHKGLYYSVGDREVKAGCGEECFCRTQYGEPECRPLKCHDDATCKIESGLWDCYCNEGYQGNGTQCTGKFLFSRCLRLAINQVMLYRYWRMLFTQVSLPSICWL